jgi:hypothetical protein
MLSLGFGVQVFKSLQACVVAFCRVSFFLGPLGFVYVSSARLCPSGSVLCFRGRPPFIDQGGGQRPMAPL